MPEMVDEAYKFGCGRYLQGSGVLEQAGKEAARYSHRAFVIGGPTALSLAGQRMEQGFRRSQMAWEFCEYGGFCCHTPAKKLAEEARKKGYGVLIGVGGGRIMDFVKLCAYYAELPVLLVPTSSATCAAYTCLSVIYDETGKTIGNFFLEKEVEAILADEEILCAQPLRLAASGILDSLSKFIEIKNGNPRITYDAFPIDLVTAGVLADHTYRTLVDEWAQICEDLKVRRLSESIRKLIFMTIPVTGMISGLSKAVGQSAIGHELYYQLRTYFTKESLGFLHGEIVAVGLLTQLVYNGTPEEVDGFRKMMREMGMPISISGLGIEPSRENFELLYGNLCRTRFVGDSEEKRSLFRKALLAIF